MSAIVLTEGIDWSFYFINVSPLFVAGIENTHGMRLRFVSVETFEPILWLLTW